MNHLAIMREPWMSMVENGIKTIESRISQKRIAPWRKVEIGDWIYFRQSGNSLVYLKAKVKDVKYWHGLIIFEKLRQYQHEIGITEEYIQSKLKGQYLTLIWLDNPIHLGINSFSFVQKGQLAWIINLKITGSKEL